MGSIVRSAGRAGALARHLAICSMLLFTVLPVAWVILMSVKSIPDAYSGSLWPQQFDLSHYGYVLTQIPTLPRNMLNSALASLASVAGTTICAVLAGYALVYVPLAGRAVAVTILIASLLIPTRLLSLIPVFEAHRALGLHNTLAGLIPPYVAMTLALCTLIIRGMVQQIPRELVEASQLDGCGPWRTLGLLLPLLVNGVVVVVVLSFVQVWGEYLLAVTLTDDQALRTLPVVLASTYGGVGQWAWPRIAALYVLTAAPGLLLFALLQRLYVRGLIEGARQL